MGHPIQPEVSPYQVSRVPVASMPPEHVRKEAKDLRVVLAQVQSRISTKKAHMVIDGLETSTVKKTELERAREFHARAFARYVEIRSREKELNRMAPQRR